MQHPSDNHDAHRLEDLAERSARQRKRHYARAPQTMKDLVARMLASGRFGAVESNERLESAWAQAAGEAMAGFTRPGAIRRGTLEVVVANNLVMQELGFERDRLLTEINKLLPDARVRGLRFRVGPTQP